MPRDAIYWNLYDLCKQGTQCLAVDFVIGERAQPATSSHSPKGTALEV